MLTRFATLVALVVATGCSDGGSNVPAKPPQPASSSTLPERAKALEGLSVTKVTLHQVDPRPVSDFKEGLSRWNIRESRVIDDVAVRDRVIRILTSPESYAEYGAKCFDPGMAFSIDRGNAPAIDIVICLECEWAYFFGVESAGSNPGLSKKGRSELARVFKDVFGYAQPSAYQPGKTVEP